MTSGFPTSWAWAGLQAWGGVALSMVVAALAAVIAHRVAVGVLTRLSHRRRLASAVLASCRGPGLWLFVFLAVQFALLPAPDSLPALGMVRHILRLLIIGATGWLAVAACSSTGKAIIALNPADVADNLGARRIQTQTQVLVRCLNAAIVLVALAAALLTFPGVREIGASLMASAGLMGLIAGFAARPVLGNLIAGLQLALTQPIRLDDVLIVLGEWGRVEEITGAYVVVRLWDERRMVVPLQWFVENPFQNWTRRSAQLIGSVFLWVDHGMPVDPLREELARLCRDAPEWDGRVAVLQVTDVNDRAMQLRALVSSADSGRNWDLRCKVREGLMVHIRRQFPQHLPRLRAEMDLNGDRSNAVFNTRTADDGRNQGGPDAS